MSRGALSAAIGAAVLSTLSIPAFAQEDGGDLTAPPGSTPVAPSAQPVTPATPPTQPGVPAGPPPAQPTEHGVRFEAIDQATVRVFAVANVTTEQVRGRFQTRVIGLPEAGHGTGVVVDPRGVVVTARHVVEGARHVAVRFPGSGPVVPAEVVYADTDLDFAILLVNAGGPIEHVVPLPDGVPALSVRDTITAIGYPFDADRRQPQSSRGIIGGVLDDGRLQLDISVNPGNSGGPLLDANEALVGIVVARASHRMGAEGIGLAVPIAPIAAAYRQALRGGALSEAYRRLRGDALAASRIAQVVDAIVRLGGAELLEEAANFVDDPTESALIDRFRAIANETDDPDLLGLLAAFFWDCAQVILERSGGMPSPDQMQPGPTRRLADQLWRLAFALAERARNGDATIVDRSPFVGFLTPAAVAGGVGRGHIASRRTAPSGPRGKWRPYALAGYSVDHTFSPIRGFGVELYFPIGTLRPEVSTRVAFILGGGLDVLFGDGGNAVHGGLGPGLGVRFGRRGGVAFHLAYSFGLISIRAGGSSDAFLNPVGFVAGMTAKFGKFHIGGSFRMEWDEDFERAYTRILAPAIGAVF